MNSWFAAGASTTSGGRYVLRHATLSRFERYVVALNAGNHRPLLSAYHPNAVLRFPDGVHSWSGLHVGRDAIEALLKGYVAGDFRGEIAEVYFGGPPWRMTAVVRFHGHSSQRSRRTGRRSRLVLLVRTRWGRIVEQEDFFEHSSRTEAFEARLRELGLDGGWRRP
ncbi:nuclear transport factor 2 family protein [Rhodococcus gannanensis]|uniref:Nuclear transport factor 2 family protein n=1 Tax=Rhodococcus gannanensis TaxID=1960308 RepID=A0ABW4P824_9NOCA